MPGSWVAKQTDDGVLLLVALQDRALRIEVGYGLEGVLPDAICTPHHQRHHQAAVPQGDIYGGVSAGLQQIMQVVDGEPLPPPDRSWNDLPTASPASCPCSSSAP
jgi:uncharacterized protein